MERVFGEGEDVLAFSLAFRFSFANTAIHMGSF
jgi:hypothetical protein